MPLDQDFKRRVRERMAQTGERYTTARSQLLYQHWFEGLASAEHNVATFERLKALPAEELRSLALAGLREERWKVRYRCCRLLDDLTLTDETIAAMQGALADEHPRVRRAALHSLSCVHCKPDGCALDLRPLFERMANDPDSDVRMEIFGTIEWNPVFSDAWVVELLGRAVSVDHSQRVRVAATKGLERIERQRLGDEKRRELPEALRTKTERHVGKWVAIAEGRVVSASASLGTIRKQTSELGCLDAAVFWVAAT